MRPTSFARRSPLRLSRFFRLQLSLVGLLAAVLILAAGCGPPRKDRSGLLKGLQLNEVVLHCTHTDIADLALKVPPEFDIVEMRETHNDKFLIGRASDTGTSTGQIVVTVTPTPARVIADSAKYAQSLAEMFGADIVWREYTFVEEGVELNSYGPPIYQYEVLSTDPLERFNKQRGQPLFLHIFVVGSDSVTVERLVACVETMRFLPSKGNL